jgi:predicted nucleotidyltransferase
MVRPITEVKKIISETLDCLAEYLPVHSAYLFGSYAAGLARDNSDIDIAVFSPSVETMRLEEKVNLISMVQQYIKAEVEIHLFSSRRLKHARPTNFYGYILKTGKKIA